MSDDRGPPTGPGDELPDVAPRTGPPTGPAIVSAPVPAEVIAAPPVSEPIAEVIADAQEMSVPAREEITTEARNIVHAPESGWSPADLDALFASQAIDAPELVARSEPWTAPPEAEATPEIVPPAAAPQKIDPVAVPPAAMHPNPFPTVLAIPEAPSDTPVFVMVELASSSVGAQAAALPAPVIMLDLPVARSVIAPSGDPTVTDAPFIEEPDPAPAPPSPPSYPRPEPQLQVSPPPLPTTPPPLVAAPAIAASIATANHPAIDIPAPVSAPPRSMWPRRIRHAVLILIGLAVGYAVLVLSLIVAYRWVDPPRSALMIATRLSGQPVVYGPVPITSISSNLQRAVVTSEDARFCYHRGVDWAALYEAMNESRGGSTITMQVAKNLFLWSSRSYVRKAIEIPVALTIDAVWPKRRILEIYLNIAEWGPGIFGAEAASYYHFDKPASRLTAQEAALLAASLPNPIARDAGEPGRITALLATRLRGRMAHSDAFVSCLGLRPLPRAEPKAPARPATKPAARPTTKSEPQLKPWQTTTEPAFNPWQN